MKCQCESCEWTGDDSESQYQYPNIPDLWDRTNPGELAPACECPKCGALAHVIDIPKIPHGLFQVELMPNGSVSIEYKGTPIAIVDAFYLTNGSEEDSICNGKPAVQIYAINSDEPSVCATIDEDRVWVTDIDKEITTIL